MKNIDGIKKFQNPLKTASGDDRAWIELRTLDTLWFNTGTRCNLSCENCYIESNPKNDRLSFLTVDDVKLYLGEINEKKLGTQEIGLTGGEPFLNPHIISILNTCLNSGFQVLLLTNAFRIERYKEDLLRLNELYGDQLKIRVSLDHHTAEVHEEERGAGTFLPTINNIKWFYQHNFNLAVAGRSLQGEDQQKCRAAYVDFLINENIKLDFSSNDSLVVFAEMNDKEDPPEITTACWGILNKSPDEMMCSNSRMVVKRKGEDHPKVLACTLLAYDPQFELGKTISDSRTSVPLNHKFCAQFCVLGGSSCS